MDQTREITKLGLEIGASYGLCGRNSLILANFLFNSIERMITFDRELLDVMAILIEGKRLVIEPPIDDYR